MSAETEPLEALLAAILDDDRASARALLKSDPGLATGLVARPRLYRDRIGHWIYAGDTPLHLVAAGYRVELLRLLLKAGADPNAATNHRRGRPLHYAADGCPTSPQWNETRQIESIQCLLDAGAEINAQDKNGATPLHRAVRTRSAAAARYLLERGADPELRNKPGSTPFHLAVQNTGRGGSGDEIAKAAQRQIIQYFKSFGVSPALKDARGKSVLDWAQNPTIRTLLT